MSEPANEPRPGVGAFLRQLLDDASRGALRPLADYQARFPDAAAEVGLLYADLCASGGGDGRTTAPAAPAASGEVRVLGDFRILGEIGRGGMGVVYEAEQISLGRHVAVKVLANALALDDRARARFERESRVAAMLDHSGIAKVLAAHAEDDVLYFAMEFVEGAPLDQVLASFGTTPITALTGAQLRQSVTSGLRRGRTQRDARARTRTEDHATTVHWQAGYLETVVDLVTQVASALHHAHQQGVVHRDVKPANIIVRPDGSAVLTDFGLARSDAVSPLTVTGDFIGTPFYVSPEQLTAGQVPIDHRTDIYSLGVTLYELLTRRRPFEADTGGELKARILTKEPAWPKRFNPQIPHDLACIVLKAMDKDRDRRYQTAAAFAEDLQAFRAGRAVVARPLSVWTRVARWVRRNPLAAGFVGVLVVGTGALAVALLAAQRAMADFGYLELAVRVQNVRLAETDLYPCWPATMDRLEAWLRDAAMVVELQEGGRPLFARRPDLKAMLRPSFIDGEAIRERLVPSVQARLRLATMVRDAMNAHADGWRRVVEDGTTDPRYRFQMIAQIGLVPLGRDPRTGLQEFGDLVSGDIPVRDPATSELLLTPTSGIVFVLIPGGKATLGAQSGSESSVRYERQAMKYEEPVQTVHLAPFLLAKYELTVSQWLRLAHCESLAGRTYLNVTDDLQAAAAELKPVNDVDWVGCRRLLTIHGMALPTEAQWEYACRAGTDTPWSCGADAASLSGFANVADATPGATDVFNLGKDKYASFDDGHVDVAPIVGRKPNAFGLHDMHGNLAEWCEDWFGDEDYTVVPRNDDGLRDRPTPNKPTRAVRGGHFAESASDCRSARRNGASAESRFAIVGVRACRNLTVSTR